MNAEQCPCKSKNTETLHLQNGKYQTLCHDCGMGTSEALGMSEAVLEWQVMCFMVSNLRKKLREK